MPLYCVHGTEAITPGMPLWHMGYYFTFNNKYRCFVCMDGCKPCSCNSRGRQKRCWIPLVLELLMVVGCDVGPGNQMPVFYKISQCS